MNLSYLPLSWYNVPTSLLLLMRVWRGVDRTGFSELPYFSADFGEMGIVWEACRLRLDLRLRAGDVKK